ncbi:MAG: SDR family oxidoreductase [Deltaproteobacteria bacterium]|nr:SDR family oxidoreductase [Deltaproteobacteria bacterium]
MSRFTDKVVVVTGASEGIGRALCLLLAERKSKIVIAARNEERLNQLKKEIEAAGGRALSVPTDVTDENACKNLIETAVAEFGQIDYLVNNAGRTMWTMFEDIQDTSIFEQLIKLNYLGCVYSTYYALPYLKKTKGLIAVVSSVAGLTGVPSRTAYSASKHALFGFFDSLRIELKDTGVAVTMVAPDFVLSEMHKRAFAGSGNALGESPLQESKIMTAEKCASLILAAMEKRDRLLITSLRGKLGRWMKLIAPSVVDKMAAKAIKDKR